METVRLVCAVVGQPDSLITVEVGRKALIAVVKFLIKKNAPSKIACDVCQLQLFLAMKNGEWFAHDDPDAVALQAGERTHEIECIVARPSLESLAIVVQYFDENYLSDRSAVQILVLLPDPEDQPNEQGQTALTGWSSSKILEPPLDFDVMNPTLSIPAVYVQGTGIGNGQDGIVLYCRQPMVEQMRTIKSLSMDHSATTWITGAPGTGESCAALALACSIDRTEWDVLWIHISGDELIDCVRISQDMKWTCRIEEETASLQLKEFLLSTVRKAMVFLDGYVESDKLSRTAKKKCMAWYRQKTSDRRLVFVTSMESGVRNPLESHPIPAASDRDKSLKIIGSLGQDDGANCTTLPTKRTKMSFQLMSWTWKSTMRPSSITSSSQTLKAT